MTRKAESSYSAVQSMKVQREPIQTTEKWRWKNVSALCADRSALHASIHYLRQWPYHSKIARADTVADKLGSTMEKEDEEEPPAPKKLKGLGAILTNALAKDGTDDQALSSSQ